MIYLTLAELLHVAERAAGRGLAVRDHGLLAAALARPRTTVAGADADPTLDHKAAALLHSLVRNHALVDGDKRLALAGLIAFYGMNGRRLTISNDDACELVMRVAVGDLDEITDISHLLAAGTGPWPDPGTMASAVDQQTPQRAVESLGAPGHPWQQGQPMGAGSA